MAIPRISRDLGRAPTRLDELADGVSFRLGYNLLDFEIPHLRAANPNLRLVPLAAEDRLRLNLLAFPRNPYVPTRWTRAISRMCSARPRPC